MIKRSVVVFGKSSLAVRLSEFIISSKEFELTGVVPCKSQPKWCDDIGVWAAARNFPFIKSGLLSDLGSLKANIGISCYFDQIFKAADITRFDLLLNIHNSALPKHRGVGPIEWSMRDGSGIQGVTIHKIDNGIDTGPILSQVTFSIGESLTSHEIFSMCTEFGFTLTKFTFKNLGGIIPYPQDQNNSTYHSRQDTHKMLKTSQKKL